jgi:hypothetical protein
MIEGFLLPEKTKPSLQVKGEGCAETANPFIPAYAM